MLGPVDWLYALSDAIAGMLPYWAYGVSKGHLERLRKRVCRRNDFYLCHGTGAAHFKFALQDHSTTHYEEQLAQMQATTKEFREALNRRARHQDEDTSKLAAKLRDQQLEVIKLFKATWADIETAALAQASRKQFYYELHAALLSPARLRLRAKLASLMHACPSCGAQAKQLRHAMAAEKQHVNLQLDVAVSKASRKGLVEAQRQVWGHVAGFLKAVRTLDFAPQLHEQLQKAAKLIALFDQKLQDIDFQQQDQQARLDQAPQWYKVCEARDVQQLQDLGCPDPSQQPKPARHWSHEKDKHIQDLTDLSKPTVLAGSSWLDTPVMLPTALPALPALQPTKLPAPMPDNFN